MKRLRLNLGFIVCFIVLSVSLYGQSNPNPPSNQSGAIKFEVLDSAGREVFPVSISLINENGLPIEKKTFKRDSKTEFSDLQLGKYRIEVEANGFETAKLNIEVTGSENYKRVILSVLQIKENVDITSSDVVKRSVVTVFDHSMSREEIDSLPDNPQVIAKVLKSKYGDDIVIEVDGFTDMGIPSKDQIESISVLRSSFDVEFHEPGKTVVKIRSKPPDRVRWSGFLNFNAGNQFLNARNAFEENKLPNSQRFFVGFINGPFLIKRSMFSFGLTNISTSRSNPVLVENTEDATDSESKFTLNLLVPIFKVSGTLANGGTYNGIYSFLNSKLDGLGVGGINLPERGFSTDVNEHRFRFSFSNVLEKGLLNETFFESYRRSTIIEPRSRENAIIVGGTLGKGGATIDRDSTEFGLRASNTSNFTWKNNQIKFGGRLEFDSFRGRISDNLNGTFIFLNLYDYNQERPLYFRKREETSNILANQLKFSGFVQDHILINERVSVTFGVRYELQNRLFDNNNLSPRFSLVAAADKDSRLVFRIGAGIFYPWFNLNDYANLKSNETDLEYSVLFPSFPDPNAVEIPLLKSGNRKSIDAKLKNPETYIAQATANFRINKMFELESTYRFTRFTHMFRSRDLNFPVAFIKPMPLVGTIAQLESSGSGMENSFETSLQSYFSHGISANFRYRLAKNVSNYDDKILDLPANSNDLRSEFGPSDLDRRHSFNGNFSFSVFDRISIISTFKYESPLPFTIITGRDENGDSVVNDRPIGIARNSARGGWLKRHNLIAKYSIPLTRERKENNASSDTERGVSFGKSIGVEIAFQNIFNQNSKLKYVGNRLSPFYLMPTASAPARSITFGLSYFF